MVLIASFLHLTSLALILKPAVAHPGHDLSQEIAERNAFYQTSRRDLSHCDAILRKRGLHQSQHERRMAALAKAREERGLPHKAFRKLRRDATDESHLSSLDVTPTTSGVEEIIFGNSTCLLSPEGEEGPFYVKGEYIRSDIAEDQPGVPTVWDLQFLDVDTCEPITDLTSDIWHCNSTGVYAGVIANGNGNSADTSNIDKTFLRGLQTTDSEGVVSYSSIFPGYYSGRATHVHVETHLGGEVLDNGTYTGGTIAHIGQFFFDQDLITEVNQLSPYSENTITVTENADDRVVQAELANDADPFLNYVLLGDSLSDGLFMWVTIGVNTSATYTSSPASELTADGGVAVSGSSSSGTGSGPGSGSGSPPSGSSGPDSGNSTSTTTGSGSGNGTRPSGGMPSGGPGSTFKNSTATNATFFAGSSSTGSGSSSTATTSTYQTVSTSGAGGRLRPFGMFF